MKTRKAIKTKLEKLNDTKRKDTVIDFEQLGVDRLFIDESHFYKNLYLYTKMRNVGGIAQTEAQKSSDLFMKCRYLDEITGNRGTVFATGTPVSNSMVELYSVQRYLQYDTLAQNGLQHFDSWASTFGETVTALELAPEGTNYRAKTRFAKFYNLPELMQMFREVADIQTADMLMNKDSFISNIKKKYNIDLAHLDEECSEHAKNIKRPLVFTEQSVSGVINAFDKVLVEGFNVGRLRELYEALYSENERDAQYGKWQSIRLIKEILLKFCNGIGNTIDAFRYKKRIGDRLYSGL